MIEGIDPLIIYATIIVIAIAIIYFIIRKYNELTYWREVTNEMWGQIEVVLQKRYDLIPAIVEVAKGYAKHEKGTFVEVAQARSKWKDSDDPDERAKLAGTIEKGLVNIQAVAEDYPKLRADKQFGKLMREMTATENQLAKQRMKYNHYVKRYNVRVKQFPKLIIAKAFGFKEKSFFQYAEE